MIFVLCQGYNVIIEDEKHCQLLNSELYFYFNYCFVLFLILTIYLLVHRLRITRTDNVLVNSRLE